jgi:hypothetical protein
MTHILRIDEMVNNDPQLNGYIKQLKSLVKSKGGYVEVDDEHFGDLQICNGSDEYGNAEGEWFEVMSMDNDGVHLNSVDDDFYSYEDLTLDDIVNLINYIEEM